MNDQSRPMIWTFRNYEIRLRHARCGTITLAFRPNGGEGRWDGATGYCEGATVVSALRLARVRINAAIAQAQDPASAWLVPLDAPPCSGGDCRS